MPKGKEMNIYLIRHSDSEGISKGLKDSERKLTPEGELKIRNASLFWKNLIPEFDYIFSSPYLRALQTAKIIASVYNHKKDCLLYTSDAADEEDSVDLGGRRII